MLNSTLLLPVQETPQADRPRQLLVQSVTQPTLLNNK